MNWTKEPWIAKGRTVLAHGRIICISVDRSIAELGNKSYIESAFQDEIDIKRIVACVNALAGMPQDDVEELAKIPGGAMALTVYADDLLKQRDELLSALKYWLPENSPFSGFVGSQDAAVAIHMEKWKQAKFIIAKAEGRQD
jgi:hypothetical protein